VSIPRATVRLQFHRDFTLDDARDVVGFYADLGISHFYASPLTAARPGSTHGYDVIDYDAINPELGGYDALVRLGEALRVRGMGLVLDIVPNHMAASEHNRWWRDVLSRGRASEYADYFDIDWESADPELHGRVLLPVLARPLAEAIANIRVVDDRGELLLDVGAGRLPIAQETLEPGAIPADYDDRTRLRALIDRQHYALAHWRDAATRINWRRFFEISDLVALRMDRAHVFEAVHRLVFRLYADGLIDGVRVDHIDGIADPRVYCERLRAGFARTGRHGAPYVVVEKILARGERLREDWRVDGTTGYDFMDLASALLHDASGASALDTLWREVGGEDSLATTVRIARREIATTSFPADVDGVVRAWSAIEHALRIAPQPDAATMRAALVRVLETFERYRTYLEPGRDDAHERAVLDLALAQATVAAEAPVRDAIVRLGRRLIEATREADSPASTLLRRFQQLTPPVAAKAVEDTAFYRYGRLISRNEVGADPAQLAIGADTFHASFIERAERTPHAMLATATHDHKRGEDVRARLAVLSELAEPWSECVKRWRMANAKLRITPAAPSPADEYMLYQTLIGAWPTNLGTGDPRGLAQFADRIEAWQLKAIREAKLRTGWIDPDAAYEHACASFLRALLDPAHTAVGELDDFAARIAPAGAVNGLVQTLLRSTAPGVPDLYQGCDRWDLSLVDPDNRRAVDYSARRDAALDGDIAVLASHWRDGRVKQAVLARVLHARAAHAEVFAAGAYQPLVVEGPLREHVIAFARAYADELVVVLAARGIAGWLDRDTLRMRASHWRDTIVRTPHARMKFIDVLTRRPIALDHAAIALEEAFETLPLALLTRAT